MEKYAKRDYDGDSTVNNTFTENSVDQHNTSLALGAGVGTAGVFQIANTSYNSPMKNLVNNNPNVFNEQQNPYNEKMVQEGGIDPQE